MSEIPGLTGRLDPGLVTFALEIVASSGVCSAIEAELETATGRPRTLSSEALLVALVLLALEERPLHLSLATELLWRRLPPAVRTRLGISGEAATRRAFLARYRTVRYLFGRICSALDPEGLPKNRRLPVDVAKARTKSVAPAEHLRRRGALEGIVAGLLGATLALQEGHERALFDGAVGLDATPVPLYSRGPSRRSGLCASDPDGGWYVREGDHRGVEDHKGRVRGKVAWALEATIVVMATPPGRPVAHPSLVVGLCLSRPGVDPGGTGARMLAAAQSHGHRSGFLGADRAYSSARADVFHLPVRALGYTPVFDYRGDELGVQANSQGALLVEGAWCCPAIPAVLVQATADHRGKRIGDEEYATRIAARAEWRLRVKSGPDVDGYERFSCPAVGTTPHLSCPLRPASRTRRDGTTKVLFPPEIAPRCCQQASITIAPDIGARHRQRLAFGTEEWRSRYATCRNTIEGVNGFLKDGAHEALGDPSRRRVRGVVAQSLFCALLVMAANIRKLRAFREIETEGDVEAVTERARRRRTSLADHRPGA
ncbi:MAG TPA: hypothetical protein VNF07_06670 [Acidimicrobiales bacterium]|nr:hypothetical protein [Acidimicrobiales bacterium]